MSVWINEFHYDDNSTDEGEFIEIAGLAGFDLTGWSIVLYNGSSSVRAPYDTLSLDGLTIDDEGDGYGAVFVDATDMQNGGPDGLALVDNLGTVIQFLSYEGSFEALSGPAAGMVSVDVGVAESNATPEGQSLQLAGTGSLYADFAWTGPATATPGTLNTGQTLLAPGPVLVAAEDFDGGALNLVAGFDPATDNLDGGAGDWFGVGSIGAWPQSSVPFSLTDDTVADVSGGGVFAADAEGIFGQNRDLADAFFGLSDSDEFGAAQTASWTFDISGYKDLMLSISMGGISDSSFIGFSSTTDATFIVSIDGAAAQTAFDLDAVDNTFGHTTRLMDAGTASGGGRLLTVSGDNAVTKLSAEDGSTAADTFLDKATVDTGLLDTFQTAITGTGATLTLTLTADMPFEAMAFDDIRITGTSAPITGGIYAIEALDADKPEGEAGATDFTFTVTRSGDTSGAGTVDWAVSGDVDAADFGGTLPSGTASFAAGETETTVTIQVSGDTDDEGDEDFTVTLSNPTNGAIAGASAAGRIVNDDFEITLISEIQGNAATWGEQFGRTDATPFFGATVAVSAVVVGDFQEGDGNFGGFYLQEEDGDADGDATTSEGIFVFDAGVSTGWNVNVGDTVTVIGTATEFFGETQLNATQIIVESSGNALPTAATITFPIAETIVNGDGQVIANLEAYEGMLVTLGQDMTVADLFDYGRFGEMGLYADGRLETYTQSNTPSVTGFQDYIDLAARNTVTLDDGSTWQNPFTLPYPDGSYGVMDGLSSGDTVSDVTGVVRYSRGSGSLGDENYRINPTALPTFTDTNPRQETPPDVGGSLKVASYNVLNYFNGDGMGGGFPTSRGADSAEEFARQQEKLVAALSAIDADVVGLMEIEKDGYGPQSAIPSLVDALNAAMGAGTYAYVDPGVASLGSDEIAVGFLYKPGTVALVGASAILDKSVDARFDSDNQRPSLAQTFEEIASGETFTAVVNHLKSKGSPVDGVAGDEDQGDGAGNANTTRTLAAEALADWIATDPTGSGDSDVLVIGDLNSYAMEDPIQALLAGADDSTGTGDDLVNLAPVTYTYAFPLDLSTAGQVQGYGTLDYALGTASLAAQVTGAAAWHLNADEPSTIDYNTEFKPDNADLYAADAFRSSDHDPMIVGLDLAPDALVARLDFEGRFPRQHADYTLDGDLVATQRLKLLDKSVDLGAAGVTIEAVSGASKHAFVTSWGQGLGVAVLGGSSVFAGRNKVIDGDEVLRFTLDEVDGLGDALAASFEFGKTRGTGDAVVSLYDDGALVDSFVITPGADGIAFDLPGTADFDMVELGVTDDFAFSLEAVEFLRIEGDVLVV
ncbi:ExeM/NucH family extracellular endonuclease [Mesobacterium pallidum]|uniref:ExeM/NucH family extracellular endonuclease n=1 Tax=Mesobacterium pallidum TaxID=2872037 RepID=UPI001EE33FB6|nr:ExeM/NucH family extracellular endonuclease [Mesobacterium pallidum]